MSVLYGGGIEEEKGDVSALYRGGIKGDLRETMRTGGRYRC